MRKKMSCAGYSSSNSPSSKNKRRLLSRSVTGWKVCVTMSITKCRTRAHQRATKICHAAQPAQLVVPRKARLQPPGEAPETMVHPICLARCPLRSTASLRKPQATRSSIIDYWRFLTSKRLSKTKFQVVVTIIIECRAKVHSCITVVRIAASRAPTQTSRSIKPPN